MKNYVKVIVSFVFLMAAVAFIPVASKAAITAPTGLRQTDADSNSVTVSWGAVPDAKGYGVQWSNDGTTWGNKVEDAYSPEKTLWSLSAGSTLYVRVGVSETSYWPDEVSDIAAWSQSIEVVTGPDATSITDISCVGATTTSLTYQWTPCVGATSYNLYNRENSMSIGTTAATSFTWEGLLPNTGYSIQIEPVKISSSGFVARSSTVKSLIGAYTMPEKPVTPTTSAFGISSTWDSINVVYFSVNVPTGCSGYELEVYQIKGNKKAFTGSGYDNRMVVKRNQGYKYRARFYVNYNGQKVYGNWSGYRFFCFQSVSGKKYNSYIKLKWSKVSGAKNYTVYVSTSKTGGYKKVKTLGAKASGITIRKCGKSKIKKNKKYYVRVIPTLKNGKQAVKSDYYYSGETVKK